MYPGLVILPSSAVQNGPIMESLPKLPILEFTDDTIEDLRKIHNLHEPGRMDQAIDILSDWAKKQEHFLKKDFPRDYLERIIISAKGSLEKAKSRLDGLCTLRTLAPHHFPDGDLSNIKKILDGFRIVIFPKFAPEYYRPYLIKGYAKHLAPSDFPFFYHYSIRLCEYWMKHDYFNGFILIFDYTHKDFNIKEFMTNTNPSDLHQHITAYIKVYGARLKGIHIVTGSKLADTFFMFMKPFFGAKLANRFHIHKKMEDVFDYVPKDLFASDYGGKEMSVVDLHDKWFEVLNSEEHIEYMREVVQTRTDESKRLSDKLNNEYLGMPGTFRPLRID